MSIEVKLSRLMCFHIKFSARYNIIVQCQFLYHHHGHSKVGTWAMVPKKIISIICPYFANFIKR